MKARIGLFGLIKFCGWRNVEGLPIREEQTEDGHNWNHDYEIGITNWEV